MSQKINIKALDINQLLKKIKSLEKENSKLRSCLDKAFDASAKASRLIQESIDTTFSIDDEIQYELRDFIEDDES